MRILNDFRRTFRFISSHPIARNRPVAAMWRWLIWQLRSRATPGPHLINWVGGARLSVQRSMHGATGNIYCGLHEFADMAFVLHFLSGQDDPTQHIFVDVGANVGSYTILAASVVGSRVVTIEPSPGAFDGLSRNIAVNELEGRVQSIQAAVGAAAGDVRFSVDRDCENQVVDENYCGLAESVPLKALDDILEGLSPVLMKLDVEGFEDAVIAGARKVLQTTQLHAILLEGVSPACKQVLEESGFVRRDYEPISRSITHPSGETHLGNQLWLREEFDLQAICRKAPVRDVFGLSL